MTSTPSSELAVRLAEARYRQQPIENLPDRLRPASLEEAYDVQSVAQAITGAPTAAFKVGLTSPGARRAFGAEASVFGRLAAEDVLRSPAIVHARGLPRFAEAEIMFRIEGRLDPDLAPFSARDIASSLGEAFAGIEICSTRYAWDDVTLPELIADNCSADGLVVGDPLRNWRAMDLGDLPVTLRRENAADVEGSTSAVLGNPIWAVIWLANELARRGVALEPGQIVASGSCTGVIELGDRERLVVTIGDLGEARAEITPAYELGNSR